MTNQEKYILGCNNFQPSPTDNPDCIPFYRSWAGFREVLEKGLMDKWHYIFHQAICWTERAPLEERYGLIVQHLREAVDTWKQPDVLKQWGFWEASPREPKEKDVRDYFNRQYKRAFPGKRVNSKDANAKWEEKKAQALTILQEQYQTALTAYQARQQDHDDREKKAKQDWIDKFRAQAEFEEFVRGLEGK